MVQELDLSSNRITSIDGLLPYLVECQILNLDDNLIEELACVENNALPRNKNTVGGQKLKVISLKRNPICEREELVRKIKETPLGKMVLF